MKLFIAVFVFSFLYTCKSETDYHAKWLKYKQKYNKNYGAQHIDYAKFATFIENLIKIREHNKQNHSFTLKENAFLDHTHEEYKEFLRASFARGKPENVKHFSEIPEVRDLINNVKAPHAVDWRNTTDVVSPVKDQGQCGSCYAFGATGAAESNWVLKGREPVLFSEQQIVDCSGKYGNLGCNGGLQEYVYEYGKKFGFMQEEDYPYVGHKTKCAYAEGKTKGYVRYYYATDMGNENHLVQGLAAVGPMTIAIDASDFSFQFYSSGVYYSSKCGNGPYDLDHAVLAVGYGTEQDTGKDYFIVKNSWGEDWGQNGYILMSRNKNNNCGVATIPIAVVLE